MIYVECPQLLCEVGYYDRRLHGAAGKMKAPELCNLLKIVWPDGARLGWDRKQSDCWILIVPSFNHTVYSGSECGIQRMHSHPSFLSIHSLLRTGIFVCSGLKICDLLTFCDFIHFCLGYEESTETVFFLKWLGFSVFSTLYSDSLIVVPLLFWPLGNSYKNLGPNANNPVILYEMHFV